jgi:hypothetical protein
MLTLTTVLEIRRLLDEGRLSQRAIAAKLRVSRGVVGSIANGTRGLFGHDDAPRPALEPIEQSRPKRCQGCGGLVYLPCLLCRARRHRKHADQLRRLAATTERPPGGPGRRVA